MERVMASAVQYAGAVQKPRYCFYCRRRLGPGGNKPTSHTRDHIIARAHGGKQTVSCCRQCNNLKGDMTIEQWSEFMDRNPQWWTRFNDRGDVVRWRQAMRWVHKRPIYPPPTFPKGLVPFPPLCRGLP